MTGTEAWLVCADCEERHAPDYDCKTYAPVCACGHRGNRRFRFVRPGVLRDVLAPSLGPGYLECSVCEGTDIWMEVARTPEQHPADIQADIERALARMHREICPIDDVFSPETIARVAIDLFISERSGAA